MSKGWTSDETTVSLWRGGKNLKQQNMYIWVHETRIRKLSVRQVQECCIAFCYVYVYVCLHITRIALTKNMCFISNTVVKGTYMHAEQVETKTK